MISASAIAMMGGTRAQKVLKNLLVSSSVSASTAPVVRVSSAISSPSIEGIASSNKGPSPSAAGAVRSASTSTATLVSAASVAKAKPETGTARAKINIIARIIFAMLFLDFCILFSSVFIKIY